MKPTPKIFGSSFLLILIGSLSVLPFFQNCGNVGLNSASQRSVSGDKGNDNNPTVTLPAPTPAPTPTPVVEESNIDPAFVNCNRSWSKSVYDVNVGANLVYFNSSVYMARTAADKSVSYDRFSLATKTFTNGPVLRYNGGDPCTSVNDAILDESNSKIYLSATCFLGASSGYWHIIFEINSTTLAVEKSIFPGQLIWNFARASNGDILASSMYWNADQKKYCAELMIRSPNSWNKFGTYRCEAYGGQLLINSKDEMFVVDSNNTKKILNYLTGEVFQIETPMYLSSPITDYRGDIYVTARDLNQSITTHFRFDRKEKKVIPIGSSRSNYMSELLSVYGDTYLSYGYVPALSSFRMEKTSDFSNWSEVFKTTAQYPTTNNQIATTYLIKSGYLIRPSGDIYLAGTVWDGYRSVGQLWQYTCN